MVNSSCSWVKIGQGSPIWPVIGLNCPCSPNELIRPITGFFGVPNSLMSLATSYSRNSSRSAWKLGIDGAAVGGIGAGQSKIQRIAAAGLQRLQSEFRGAVLIVGERLRIDDVQMNLAAGARRQLLEKLAHARGVGHDQGRLLGGGCRARNRNTD